MPRPYTNLSMIMVSHIVAQRALVFLDPQTALSVLEHYSRQFGDENWIYRLRAHALWRLGEFDESFADLNATIEKRVSRENLLAAAHFYLESGDLQCAQDRVDEALGLHSSESRSVCVLTQAVLSWLRGEKDDAQVKLQNARRIDKIVVRIQDLRCEQFWGPKAIGALEAMLKE